MYLTWYVVELCYVFPIFWAIFCHILSLYFALNIQGQIEILEPISYHMHVLTTFIDRILLHPHILKVAGYKPELYKVAEWDIQNKFTSCPDH